MRLLSLMKLNDFTQKRKRVIKKPTQFVLQNDAAELKYQKQIDDLYNELDNYKKIEVELTNAKAYLQIKQEATKELKEVNDSLIAELKASKFTIEQQEESLLQLPNLKEEIKNFDTELSSTKRELARITKTAFQQSSDISRLAKDLEQTQQNNKVLEANNKQAVSNKLSANIEKEEVQEKNKELQSFVEKMSKINIEVKEKHSELNRRIAYLDKESKEAQVQLDESLQVEAKLKKWISDLEKQKSINTSVKGELNNKVVSLETTIKDMSKLMDNLMEELKYLRTVNKEYRKELAKPRYVSMGTIAKREGFKIPFEKENIRTHNLGNSAPTLLKFKAEGENHDN